MRPADAIRAARDALNALIDATPHGEPCADADQLGQAIGELDATIDTAIARRLVPVSAVARGIIHQQQGILPRVPAIVRG